MASMEQYGRRLLRWAPRWLRGGDGRKFLRTLGGHLDRLLDGAIWAVKAPLPGVVSEQPELISLIGQDRMLIRGYQEPNQTYFARLRGFRKSHARRGTGYEMLNQLRILMGAQISRTTLSYRNGVQWVLDTDGSITRTSSDAYSNNGPAPSWARYWVEIEGNDVTTEMEGAIRAVSQQFNSEPCLGYWFISNGDRLWDGDQLWDSAFNTWDSNGLGRAWEVRG